VNFGNQRTNRFGRLSYCQYLSEFSGIIRIIFIFFTNDFLQNSPSTFVYKYSIRSNKVTAIISLKPSITLYHYIVYLKLSFHFRILPAYCAVMAITAHIIPHLGHGPIWPNKSWEEAEICKNYWWANLLFINNFLDIKHQVVQFILFYNNNKMFHL